METNNESKKASCRNRSMLTAVTSCFLQLKGSRFAFKQKLAENASVWSLARLMREISDSLTDTVREARGSEDEDVNKQRGQSGSETRQRVVMCPGRMRRSTVGESACSSGSLPPSQRDNDRVATVF